MSHRHCTWRSVLAGGTVPPVLRTLREERWWAKSLTPSPGFQSRDGGNISPRIQAGEEAWVQGRWGGLGRRMREDLQLSRGSGDARSSSLAWLWAIGRH